MMAAHNWRALRLKALGQGITNIMACPSMHVVLDLIEQLGAEASVSEAKSQTEARSELTRYYDKLYKPDITAKVINGESYFPPPPGFSDEEVEASFDAFLSNPMR
ncbi:hypothetical protein SEA_ROSCOE_41 [Mycobacterium phage Roscoe]|nr:hypothetical protein VISTA_40 [Mycobacterium phage Vista]YP_009018353.1 hypothetical protein CL95_gp040 [Mycobacterium phage JacAttac]YP_009043314.1 hypothetical protein HL05_gp039 [Mycobacterium phage Manad]YP_009187550.1 hypothetical protein PBI_SWISH_40 [Mycobacterium phage Swish]YP_009189278.1 gp40 [Mycobacterium phage ShiVal]YP_009191134.1 hypothetical protein AU108_gp40 [Mycobacterium phage Eremos]AEJ95226.1 hypothetical protein KLUCKY39_40 [Mycobacterium phage KLucky39]AEK09034.1 h